MKKLIFISSFAVLTLWGGQSEARSAYEIMRSRFAKATMPYLEDLKLGRDWYCSSSEEAARGLFRYVPFWRHRFQFHQKGHEIENLAPKGLPIFTYWLAAFVGRSELKSQYIRVDRDGNFVVEVTSKKNRSHLKKVIKASLSDPRLPAEEYWLCENPDTHDNKDWHEEPEIWSEEDL